MLFSRSFIIFVQCLKIYSTSLDFASQLVTGCVFCIMCRNWIAITKMNNRNSLACRNLNIIQIKFYENVILSLNYLLLSNWNSLFIELHTKGFNKWNDSHFWVFAVFGAHSSLFTIHSQFIILTWIICSDFTSYIVCNIKLTDNKHNCNEAV